MNAGGIDLWIVAVFWALVVVSCWLHIGYEELWRRLWRNGATVKEGRKRVSNLRA